MTRLDRARVGLSLALDVTAWLAGVGMLLATAGVVGAIGGVSMVVRGDL